MSEIDNNSLGGSAQSIEGGQQAEGRQSKRPWTPNKKRKVTSKKSLDKKKLDQMAAAEHSAYKGELDPRKSAKEKRKPRTISRSEEKVMAKARALASDDPIASSLTQKNMYTDFRNEYSKCAASPGRLGALYATQQVRKRNGYAQEIIESTIDASHLTQQDRSFATLLTLGVVSTVGALDQIIDKCLDKPTDVKADVRDALRISAYEIIYLRKSPHAAIDQGVELVRAVAPSAAGLGNAVLHRVFNLTESFPFGDPTRELEALSMLYAFPQWLAKQLIADLGPQDAIALMKASNDPAPVFIAVNSILASNEEIFDAFSEAGALLEPALAGGVEVRSCFRVSDSRVLADGRIRRLFNQGKILVSDASAQAIAQSVLEDGKPDSLLEIGAGRGTKTILLQSGANREFGEQLDLTPLDTHGFKADVLKDRVQSYGVQIDDVAVGNAKRLESVIGNRMFSRIFIDAPCSGLGTLRRHHEIRWRLAPEQIEELAATNLALLRSAANHVEVGGSIIYSTCTVTYAENNGTVKAFLESNEGRRFALAPINGKACFTSQLTQGSPDAHFAAKFVRKS